MVQFDSQTRRVDLRMKNGKGKPCRSDHIHQASCFPAVVDIVTILTHDVLPVSCGFT